MSVPKTNDARIKRYCKNRDQDLAAARRDYRKIRNTLQEIGRQLENLLEDSDQEMIEIDRGWLLELEAQLIQALKEGW